LGIRISVQDARRRLEKAFEWASSGRSVPEDWAEFTRQTFEMPSMTYTPALGTLLLARATDDRVDPLSIKIGYGTHTYSQRTLGNGVLVPAARELRFSIRNTGREPLNNQPFFRYDHMSLIDRVRYKEDHARFMAAVAEVETFDRDQALAALAAFLRVAITVAEQSDDYVVEEGVLTVQGVVAAVEAFLGEEQHRPRRAQALVAAAFDVTHDDVRTRRLNDPSRDFPGDVQAFEDEKPLLAVEVRGKSVPPTEVTGFVDACRRAGIDRAFLVVLWPAHRALPGRELRQWALEDRGVLLTIIERAEDLLLDVFGWCDLNLATALRRFVTAALDRLKEIEVPGQVLGRWVALTGELGSADSESTGGGE
jgi:hypothetical protein